MSVLKITDMILIILMKYINVFLPVFVAFISLKRSHI